MVEVEDRPTISESSLVGDVGSLYKPASFYEEAENKSPDIDRSRAKFSGWPTDENWFFSAYRFVVNVLMIWLWFYFSLS